MNLKTKLISGFASAAAIALITVSFLGYYYAKNQVVNDKPSDGAATGRPDREDGRMAAGQS